MPLKYYFIFGVREMAQWTRTLTALAEELGLVSSTHTVTESHLELSFRRSDSSSGLCGYQAYTLYMYIYAG